MPSFVAGNAVPPYLRGLVGEPSSTSRGDTTRDYYSFTRPADFDTLRSFYDRSVGDPDPLSGLGSSAINNIFTNAVRANLRLARERGGANRGERGLAPVSSGVASQKLTDAMMPLSYDIAKRILETREKGLTALFAAASGPISETRDTTRSSNEMLATRPYTTPAISYPSTPGGGGGGRGGSASGTGGGFWDKPFDPFGGWKDIGGMRGEYDRREAAEYNERARREREIWEKEFKGGHTSSPDLPGSGSPGGYDPTGAGLGGPGVWGDDEPGAFPAQPSGGDEYDSDYEYTRGGTGATSFMARRPKGSTGSYGRF